MYDLLVRFRRTCLLIVGHPIAVSCAYSGRLAVAYRLVGPKFLADNPKGKLLNMWVAIYECESTGRQSFHIEICFPFFIVMNMFLCV